MHFYIKSYLTFYSWNRGSYTLHIIVISFHVRFSATKAMWILSPFHPIRRIALTVFTHPMFGFAIITTILVNCKVMTMPESE